MRHDFWMIKTSYFFVLKSIKKTSWFRFCFSLHCTVIWLKFVELLFIALIVKWLFWLIYFYCSKNVFFDNFQIHWINLSHFAHERWFWFIDNKIKLIIVFIHCFVDVLSNVCFCFENKYFIRRIKTRFFLLSKNQKSKKKNDDFLKNKNFNILIKK